jgi:hypothetical protein
MPGALCFCYLIHKPELYLFLLKKYYKIRMSNKIMMMIAPMER